MKLFYKQAFRISRLSKIYRAFWQFTGFKNNACNAFITKIKEPRVQTQFLVAGVERFELPDDGVRVRSLTAWRHPNFSCQNDDRLLCRARQTHFTTIFYTFFRRLASVFISIFIFFFFNSIITLPEKKFCN